MKTNKQLIILFVISCLFFMPILLHINDFIFLSGSEYSDIAITHYPNLLFIQKSILNNHHIPLWSGLIYSGYPFAANPLSGLAYFGGWLAILFTLPAGINITVILHLLLGIFGMFFFLKQEGRSDYSSLFGAIVFGFSYKVFSHLGAGHLTMLYAIMWTPWLLFLSKLAIESKKRLFKLLPGVIVGFIVTADIRWIIPVGILWVIYLMLQQAEIKGKVYLFLQSTAVGLLTSVGLWLPFIQFLTLSTRINLTPADQSIYSLKLQNLLGFFFIDASNFTETVIYPSAIVLLLVVLGIFIYKDNKAFRYWYYIAGAAVLLAFGDAIPGLKFFFEIPGLSLLRVPSRFLWLTYFSFAVVASFVFDWLVNSTRNYKFDRLFFIIPIVAFVILLMIAISLSTGEWGIKLILGALFFIFGVFWLGFSIHNKIGKIPLQTGLLILLLVDLFYFNYSSLQFISKEKILYSNSALIKRISDLPNFGRIYTPSYSLNQSEGAFWGFQQINGVDPMQLLTYADFFENASGVKSSAYSVTLPAFINGDPHSANQFSCPNIAKLEMLNVGYIISDFDMGHCGDFTNVEIINHKYVYPLHGELSIATIDAQTNGITLLNYQPDQIDLKVDRGGLLVFREIYYPGWAAYVDRLPVSLEKSDIFRAIFLSPGPHLIQLKFRPGLVEIGFAIQLLAWVILLLMSFYEKKHEKSSK